MPVNGCFCLAKGRNRAQVCYKDVTSGTNSGRRHRHPVFCNHLFFAITMKNCKTVLFEVELILNNALLTHVYPSTIETCLKPNHLLFGRQILYFSNTTSTVARNLTVLSSTTYKVNHISNHFLDRWLHGYVVNLGETQWTSKLNINSLKINFTQSSTSFQHL